MPWVSVLYDRLRADVSDYNSISSSSFCRGETAACRNTILTEGKKEEKQRKGLGKKRGRRHDAGGRKWIYGGRMESQTEV